MKGGTTSLYHYIASNPRTEPSAIKETDFFKTPETLSKGVTWYRALFKNRGKYAFEASPNYTKRHIFPGVPERMHAILPDVKLIYVLRDPIKRIVSHYIHNYAHGRELRPFPDAIKGAENNYIQTSKYHFQIQAYLKYYSKKQLLLIESEKLRKDPAEVLRTVYGFLGISREALGNNTILEKRFHTSSSKERRSLIEQKLSKVANNQIFLAMIRKICKPFRTPIETPVLSSVERARLSAEIAPDVEKLRRLSGKRFSKWTL